MAKIHVGREVEIHLLQDPIGGAHNVDPGGSFGIVVPRAATNEVLNPQARPYGDFPSSVNTTSPFDPTLVRGVSPYGYYAHRWDSASAGFSFDGSVPLAAGQRFTWCFGIRAECGDKFDVTMTHAAAGRPLGPVERIEGNGCWQYVCICGAAQLPVTVQLTVSPVSAVSSYYTAGYMIIPDRCEDHTYFDGDTAFTWDGLKEFPNLGNIAGWTGAPQGSASTINRFSRAAGILHMFDEFGLEVTGINGIGMSSVRTITQDYAILDGTYGQGQYYDESVVQVTGRLYGDPGEVAQNRACLEALVKQYHPKCREPLQLVYQCRDECGERMGEELRLLCWYDGGLEGSRNDICQEEIVMNFRTTVPFWRGDPQYYEHILQAGGNNSAPGASGAANLRFAYCVGYGKKTATYTRPKIIISASPDGGAWSLTRIENQDTGDLLIFDPPIVGGPGETLVIDTNPQTASILFNPNSPSEVNAEGNLRSAGLADFCFAPGYNNLHFQFSNITNPGFNPLTPAVGQIPPRLRVSWPTNYVSASEACACNSYNECDTEEIQTGYLDFGGPVVSPI